MTIGNNIKDAVGGAGSWVVIGDVSVSASLSELHGYEADITEHRVEEGANITDHVRNRPREVKIEAIVSNISLGTGFPGQSAVNAFASLGGEDPVLESWHIILGYRNDKTKITIVSSLETYENMFITSFQVTRTPGTQDSLSFSCTAREIRFVSTETTTAAKIPEPADASVKGADAAKQGRSGSQKANSQQTEKVNQSALSKLLF